MNSTALRTLEGGRKSTTFGPDDGTKFNGPGKGTQTIAPMRKTITAIAAALLLSFNAVSAQTYATVACTPSRAGDGTVTAALATRLGTDLLDLRVSASAGFGEDTPFSVIPSLRLKLPVTRKPNNQGRAGYIYIDLGGGCRTADGVTCGTLSAAAGVAFMFTSRLGMDIQLYETHRNLGGMQDMPSPMTYYYGVGLSPIGTTSIGLIIRL